MNLGIYSYARYGKGIGKQLIPKTKSSLWAGRLFKYLGALSFAAVLSQPSPIVEHANDKQLHSSEQHNALIEMEMEPRGFNRITRHGTFMSFALLGIGQMLTRGRLGDAVFWGSFPVFWIIGSLHQDYRLKQDMSKAFFEKTSLLPFKAIIEGRNTWTSAKDEIDGKAVLAAAVAPLFVL